MRLKIEPGSGRFGGAAECCTPLPKASNLFVGTREGKRLMRVLIFGATGHIGSAVMRAAIAAGHETVAVTRNAQRAKTLRVAGAQPVVGDMTRPETWDEAVAASDAVIHLAAAFEGDLAAADDIWTGAMEALARDGRAPKRIVYTGGCWLYPERSDPPITEADAFNPLPPFAYMIAHRDRLRAADLDVVTLHPGLVWSDKAGCTAEIGAAVAGQQPVEVIGSPETLWPLVHAEDLATLYINALRPDAACTDILAVSDPAVSVTTIIAAAEQAHGMQASLQPLPVAEAVRRHGPWVAGKARSQRIEGARAGQLLGWRPEHHFPAQGVGEIASPRRGACEPAAASPDRAGGVLEPHMSDPGRRYRV